MSNKEERVEQKEKKEEKNFQWFFLPFIRGFAFFVRWKIF